MSIGVLVYMYKERVHSEVQKNLTKMISAYRDDEDLQDLIDWIQRDWLKCCGVTTPDDWNDNVYFGCESRDKWIEACGVPPSCCLSPYSDNRQCGFGVRNKTAYSSLTYKIYQDGCLKKGEEWLRYHILPVSIVIVCLSVLQVNYRWGRGFSFFKFNNFIF